jgi:uncharacterized caspase-like protein
MKKLLLVLFLAAFAAGLSFAQQKYALVIGNGKYVNITKLNNPENDANDMAAALQGMGWTVDKVLNGTLEQMESASIRLKNRLSAAKNSYGFLFYAGHGVQSNGENYLIPVDANIQSESFLRQKAVSVQSVLNELNDAENELNVIVLDACRDNPFSWKRSGTRGLQVVGSQPADSIIVFATSAGSTAVDGTGRNGLFTGHLLNNLKTPGLEVTEVFRRTMGDVLRSSNNKQRPAVYNQFSGLAYLGTKPTPNTPVQPDPPPVPAPTNPAKERLDKGKLFFDRAEYDAAITELNEAIRLDPNSAEAYAYRARAYNGKKDYTRGFADAERAIRLDPNYAFGYYARGNAYLNDKKDYDRAIADYTEAIRLNPNSVLILSNRGVAYFLNKDYDKAIADSEAVLRIDPNYTQAKQNIENARKAKAER